MKICIRATILFFLVLAAACERSNRSVTDEFVIKYVGSIVDGSEFYKKYSTPHDLELIEIIRPKMTRKFQISSWEYVSPRESEYAISFSNGALVIVAIDERDGVVESASLQITRQPNQP
jgi:hypothetical protein